MGSNDFQKGPSHSLKRPKSWNPRGPAGVETLHMKSNQGAFEKSLLLLHLHHLCTVQTLVSNRNPPRMK